MRVLVVGNDTSVVQMFTEAKCTVSAFDPDIVCFTGGEDVSPSLYQQKNEGLSQTNLRRDMYELEVFRTHRMRNPQPLFVGICRGGQLLNVLSGGSMKQHIEGHSAGIHNIYLGEKLRLIHEDHHQGMVPSAKGQILGFDPRDENPEVVWYEHTKSLCFQPHPEWGHDPTKKLFFALLERYYRGLESEAL